MNLWARHLDTLWLFIGFAAAAYILVGGMLPKTQQAMYVPERAIRILPPMEHESHPMRHADFDRG